MKDISAKAVKDLVEILQLPPYCTSATIKLVPDNLIILETTSIITDEQAEDLIEVFKRFKLVEEGE